MLQISSIWENKDDILKRLSLRNRDFAPLLNEALEKDDQRKQVQFRLDNILAEINTISKQVGELFKAGKQAEANDLKVKSTALKEETKKLSEAMASLEAAIRDILVQIPNAPSVSVPAGKTSENNEVVSQDGSLPELPPSARPHWELIHEYGIIDFETGTKITGAGFPLYRDKGARLQRALINFFLDEAVKTGYTELQPPYLVNSASAFGTGQLPDKEGQMYHIASDDLYLIPTSEVPVTNIFRDIIFSEDQLPVKCTAYSGCFRREAGSWGKDVRGLNRLHQFDKVEIVRIEHPDRSFDALEEMVAHVKGLLQKLELPFRVVKLCGGDLGFASAMTYDMEVWSAAQKKWLEVSSISNFLSFQANRMKIRYKDSRNKTNLVHTLNGSALALPRIMAALIENNQTPDGIKIPSIIAGYAGFDIITKREQ